VVATRYKERSDDYAGYLPVFSNLATRVVFNPELRARLEKRLDKALQELFDPVSLHARIDAIHALLDADMQRDPYMMEGALNDSGQQHHGYRKFLESRQYLKDYVTLRRAFILAERKRLAKPLSSVVLWSVNPAENWVELRNRGTGVASTQGMVLTTSLRNALGMPLAAQSLEPGAVVRLPLNLPAGGEVGLFHGKSVTGVKDLLFYGPLVGDRQYTRSEEAPHAWQVHQRVPGL